jgi:hypothetical protein
MITFAYHSFCVLFNGLRICYYIIDQIECFCLFLFFKFFFLSVADCEGSVRVPEEVVRSGGHLLPSW